MAVDHPPDVHARIPRIRERLAKSASGWIRVAKFGVPDRTALSIMIQKKEVEIFMSALGKAYRFVPTVCPNCGGSGSVDSGGVTPWGDPIEIPCGCIEKGD